MWSLGVALYTNDCSSIRLISVIASHSIVLKFTLFIRTRFLAPLLLLERLSY